MKKFFLIMAFICLPFFAYAENAIPESWLKPVTPDHVCMVNDTAFDKAQIPVEVDGKTYFGCCMMCKERLEKDTAIRHAIDPVSGQKIDKASAVIGAGPDDRVFYFENQENLQKFTPEKDE